MTITTIVIAIAGVFGGGGGSASPPKDVPLSSIVESVVGAILSFLGKAVGFVSKHTWALIVFVAGLIGTWLMQKV